MVSHRMVLVFVYVTAWYGYDPIAYEYIRKEITVLYKHIFCKVLLLLHKSCIGT